MVPKRNRRQRGWSVLPMRILVTFRDRAYSSRVAATSSPESVTVSAPSRSARRKCPAICSLTAGSVAIPTRSTETASQGASRAAAIRLAVRMTRAVVGLGPTQTSSRSAVGQGSVAAR